MGERGVFCAHHGKTKVFSLLLHLGVLILFIYFIKGRLQKAAELKEDTSVLLHIREKDCVALEVRYHRTCYQRWTEYLTPVLE